MRNYRATVLAIVLLAFAGAVSGANAQSCVSSGEGQQLVAQGQVVPFPEAFRSAGYSSNELAGNPQLCQSGGGYVYRVQVVRDGQVSQISIPAN